MFPRTASFAGAFSIILAAAVALPAAASASNGADLSERHTRLVQYGDLDLATVDGRKTLNQRIVRASYQVCRSGDRLDMAVCRQRARDDAADALQLAMAKGRVYAAGGAPIVGN